MGKNNLDFLSWMPGVLILVIVGMSAYNLNEKAKVVEEKSESRNTLYQNIKKVNMPIDKCDKLNDGLTKTDYTSINKYFKDNCPKDIDSPHIESYITVSDKIIRIHIPYPAVAHIREVVDEVISKENLISKFEISITKYKTLRTGRKLKKIEKKAHTVKWEIYDDPEKKNIIIERPR